MRRSHFLAALSLLSMCSLFLVACGDDDVADAAADAADAEADAMDARSEVMLDPGLECSMSCDDPETCCLVDGEASCVDTSTDDGNCGECGAVCDEGAGTHCAEGECRCGSNEGCENNRQWMCCADGVESDGYCADIDRDEVNCGACGEVCDIRVADQCSGGLCFCGVGRERCDGTDESTCCRDEALDQGFCVDITSDREHCGACGESCERGARCLDGLCTLGEIRCEDGCGEDEICCGGACCVQRLCRDFACMEME